MSNTDYFFDGLDEMEKQLAKTIDQTYPQEFKQLVQELALDLQTAVKEKTPFKDSTGHLRTEWKCGKVKKVGNEYVVEVYNNVEYAAHVEFGHRKKGGKGFVKGSHMMELSLAEINARLPNHLKNWLSDMLNTYDL